MAFIACMSDWIGALTFTNWYHRDERLERTDRQTRQIASKRTNERANTGYEFPFDHITFFSFLASRMAIYLRREPKTRLWGILFGFQLSFNKRGECCCVLMKNTL